MSKGTFVVRPEMWPARLKVFQDVFPWINTELMILAGLKADIELGPSASIDENKAFLRVYDEYFLGSRSADERIIALHERQNGEWKQLTGLPPLGTDADWRAAGHAAGAPEDAITDCDIDTLVGHVTAWAKAMAAKQLGVANEVTEKVTPKPPEGTLDERALAVYVTHPDWTKKQIAKELVCNARSLAPKRCPRLSAAMKVYRAPDVPSGSKSSNGTMEAWE